MIGFVTWPSDKVNLTCENMLLYVIQGVKIFFSNFLASADIKVFGCTCLFAMLLLIGLTHFYILGVFCSTFCK